MNLGKRRESRVLAMKALYMYEMNDCGDMESILNEVFELEENLSDDVKKYAVNLTNKATLFYDKLNNLINNATKNWKIERMAVIDKNIIRIALVEIYLQDKVPDVVAINEAIEIAKEYSTNDSGGFVNGILDFIVKNKDEFEKKLKD
ncbi:MAG: transcription antitermination factor NusB [bacterium]